MDNETLYNCDESENIDHWTLVDVRLSWTMLTLSPMGNQILGLLWTRVQAGEGPPTQKF